MIGTGLATTVTATTLAYTGNVTYVWYLNGVAKGTGASFTFNSASSALTLTAYNTLGLESAKCAEIVYTAP